MNDPTSPAGFLRWVLPAVLAGTLILTLVLGLQARTRVIKKLRAGDTTQVNDFQRWMVMTPGFLAGQRDYVDDSLPTPPITLLVFAPYTLLRPGDAQVAWALTKALFLLGIGGCVLAMARRGGVPPTPLALALMGLVWMWPVIGDLQEGQTNLLMLLPLAGSLWLAQRQTRRDDLLAGLLLALAVCIKVTPLIFLLYFLLRRRWLVALATLAGLGLWLYLVPAACFGWTRNITWLGQWFGIMIVPYATRGQVDYFVGQSVPSFLSRLLRHVSAFAPPHRPVYINVLSLSEPAANAIIRAVLAAIALAGLWWMRRKPATLAAPRYLLETGAVAIFMLWASQRTWVPHYVSMVFALMAAGAVLSDPRESPAARRLALWALLLSAILMSLTSDVGKLFGRDGPEYARTFGVSLWATLLLLVTIARSRWARRAPEEPEVPTWDLRPQPR